MTLRDHPLHVVSFAMLAFAVLVLSACSPAGTPNPTDTIACTMDAFTCPDGTAVGRTGPNCEFVCPDATETPSPAPTTFKQYIGTSTDICMRIKYTCDGDEMFSDDNGCGCVRQRNEAAVTLCTADYNPVCAWSGENVQCLVYPCAQTEGNLCMASVNPNVAYTTPGECPAPGSAPATKCSDPRPEICTMQYDPVCATRADGSSFTAGNACGACGDADVVSHVPGSCSSAAPEQAVSKYGEYAATYNEYMGATLMRCTDNAQTVYVASGSGGFVGMNAIYTPEGELIEEYEWDDMITPNEPKHEVDLSEMTCTQLEQSVGKPSTGKLQAFDCPAERQQACTREYMPVCGQREDGTSNTYGNDCTACANSNVLSYTEGACA